MIALSGYSRTVDLPDDVAFDTEIVETAGSERPVGAEDNAAVVFFLVGAVHIVDVESRDRDMFRSAEIVEHDMDAAADCREPAMIGDFQVANLDLLDITQKDHILHGSLAFDTRARTGAVAVDDDGRGGIAGATRLQLFVPDGTTAEENPVAGPEVGGGDLCQRLPGRGLADAGICVVALGGIDVVDVCAAWNRRHREHYKKWKRGFHRHFTGNPLVPQAMLPVGNRTVRPEIGLRPVGIVLRHFHDLRELLHVKFHAQTGPVVRIKLAILEIDADRQMRQGASRVAVFHEQRAGKRSQANSPARQWRSGR